MESLIAKLLADFEQGKISRRQLIQSLAMASAAVGTAGTAVASPGTPLGLKAVNVNHISYQVADYARTRDWYKDVLGVGVTNDDGKQCYLTFGDSWILPRNQRQPGTAPKVDHIAYTIESWDMNGVETKLKSYGLTPRKDTENSFHVKDPDGFDVQISGREMTNKEIKK